jgi:peroxiredoxin
VSDTSEQTTQPDPTGADTTLLSGSEVGELSRLIAESGLPGVSLHRRYSVVFVYPGIGVGERYPELAGCTAELCTFADDTTEFIKHGIQLVGLSTQPTEAPGDFLTSFPFPTGQLPADVETPLFEILDKGEERFAARTTFVVFPDGTGVSISNIQDPVRHVKRCFDVAIQRRLKEYQDATIAYLERSGESVVGSMEHNGFLANGADSVSISTVELRTKIVSKMASPDIIEQEGRYMERINGLLQKEGHPHLFPAVIGIRTDQRPAYYLMEAANPLSLDHLLYEDEAMTKLRRDRLHILSDAMAKLSNLFVTTFRKEEPAVARYHYLERFLAIPERRDFQDCFSFTFGDSRLHDMLSTTFVIDGDFVCGSYRDQMDFLKDRIDDLVQPVGAYLHGDVHLKNMLVGHDGKSVIYVDPRIVWDGNDVGDPGFGDPLYDLGTLLHSLHITSTVLQAIDSGETEALVALEDGDLEQERSLIVWPGLLHLTGSQTVDWFVDWVERLLPEHMLGAHWQARLHVNVANALFGWLKYARSVQTRHAWIALYAGALYHLETARRHMGSATEELRA